MQPRTFASQLGAPEGPTVGPDGWILNVCSFTRDEAWPTRGGDITATNPAAPGRTRRLFNTGAGGVVGIPAALAFGPDGALYVTDEGHRAVLRVAPDGSRSRWVDSFEGEPLNGPQRSLLRRRRQLLLHRPVGKLAGEPDRRRVRLRPRRR